MGNIFEERKKLIRKCEESEKYKNEVAWLGSIITNFQEEIQQYVDKEEEFEKEVEKNTKDIKYGVGSQYLHRGALCPSIYKSYFIGGVKKGRVVNKYTKTSDYRYIFNENNQLIKSSMLTKGAEEEYYREYILYNPLYSLGIKYRNMDGLVHACRTYHCGSKIESCEFASVSLKHRIEEFQKEVYYYEENQLRNIDVYRTMGGRSISHDRYTINYNLEGLAISYSACRLIGDDVINKEYCDILYYFNPPLNLQSQSAHWISNKTYQEESMINLLDFLYNKVKPIIESWDEEGIYAISFFVHQNEESDNVPYFAISYNTEEDCGRCKQISEERWNYAFWRQDETEIIGDDETTALLLQWYDENNIVNIGEEDEDLMYDENYEYIGKGPNGYYELLQVVTDVAKKLHNEKIILCTFKREIPIIIHDLEYTWYGIEATQKGNPDGLIDMFLKAIG